MTPTQQTRLAQLYAPTELTPRQRLQRIILHALWMMEVDDLIDRLNRGDAIKC